MGGLDIRICTSRAPALRIILMIFSGSGPPYDGVVDNYDPFVLDHFTHRVELDLNTEMADGLLGFDKRCGRHSGCASGRVGMEFRPLRAYPIAEAVPESGTGMTTSASTG